MTIREFLIEVRLTKAKALLQNSNLSLAEISEIVGFNRQSYLGHVFKKHLGITPGSLRGGQPR